MYVCKYIYIYTCAFTRRYMYVYIHTYMYTYTHMQMYIRVIFIYPTFSPYLYHLSLSPPSLSLPLSPTHFHTMTQVNTLPLANIHTQQLNQTHTHQHTHTLSPSFTNTRSLLPSTYRLAFVAHQLCRFFLSDQHLFFARFFRRLFGRHFSV